MIEARAESINESTAERFSAIHNACALIAPSWPLDRFIDVNALSSLSH